MSGDKNKSGEHRADPCCVCHEALEKRIDDHSERFDKHANRIDEHDKRLSLGDVGFAEVRKDITALTEKVGSLINAAWWLIAVIATGLLITIGGVLIWAIQRMGNS